jgi:hypothetical protein
MLTPEFLALFCVQIAAKWFLVATLFRRRLALEFWPLAVFVGHSALRSSVLLPFAVMGGYREAWVVLRFPLVDAAMDALLAWGAVHAVAKHYKNTYPFTAGLIAACAAIGALTAFLVRRVTSSPWDGPVYAAISNNRVAAVIMVPVVLLGLLWFSASTVPLPKNAQLAGVITSAYFFVSAVGLSIQAASGKDVTLIRAGNFVTSVGAVGCYLAWAVGLTTAGQYKPPPGPPTPAVDLRQHVESMRAKAGG